MPREVEPSSNEKKFIDKTLQEGRRLDGRAFEEFRKLDLTFGDQYGVADVTLGGTRYAWRRRQRVLSPPRDGTCAATD